MKSLDLQKIKSTFIKTNNQQQAGLACLASVIKYYGGIVEIPMLLKNSGASVNNISLLGLCKAARHENFEANGYKGNIGFLKELENPAILHIEKDSGNEDFIVIYGWQNNKFIIGDPQWGIIEYREDELEAVWKSKTLMLLEPDSLFKTAKEKECVKREWFRNILRNQNKMLLLTGIFGLVSSIVFIIALPIIIERIEEIIRASDSKQFVTDGLFPLIFILVLIAIYYAKNGFVSRGVKSFIFGLNNRISENIFMPVSRQKGLSVGSAGTLAKAAFRFGNSVYSLTAGVPLFIPLFITALVYVSFISVWTGVAFSLLSVGLIGLVWLNRKKIGQLYVMDYQSEIQKTETLKNNFDLFRYIKLTNSGKTFTTATSNAFGFSMNAKMKLEAEKNKIDFWFTIVSVFMIVFVVAMLWLVKNSGSQVLIFQFLGWGLIYLWAVKGLASMAMGYFLAKISFNYLYNSLGKDLFQEDEELQDESEVKFPPITKLSVDKLSFAFPGKLPVLQDICFTAEKGNITAICGATGSGKSVMFSVLNRLLPFENGEITADGKNWETFSDFQWRENVSSILQPAQLFNTTILQNIGWGNIPFEPEKIIAFCKQTGFDKYINKLPDNYATVSNNISAGQKQLVALAAALYRNPKILLLDEPFVFMDDEMEAFFWQLIQDLKNEIVVIIFTANSSVKSMTDEVIILEDLQKS